MASLPPSKYLIVLYNPSSFRPRWLAAFPDTEQSGLLEAAGHRERFPRCEKPPSAPFPLPEGPEALGGLQSLSPDTHAHLERDESWVRILPENDSSPWPLPESVLTSRMMSSPHPESSLLKSSGGKLKRPSGDAHAWPGGPA